MTKILTAGTFDNFHVGHQYFLWTAQKLSTELVIIIARDKNVKRFKKNNPKNLEQIRFQRIKKEFKNIPNVKIKLGRLDGNFFKMIESENPNQIFLGYDQRFDEATCFQKFPKIEIKRATQYYPEFFKSSRF